MTPHDNSIPGAAAGPVSCPGCGGASAVEIGGFEALARVTSDCRLWTAGGRLAVCGTCALVFKPADPAFLREAATIYASYAIYHQSGGREQRVRHPLTETLVPRSRVLVQLLSDTAALNDRGALLDAGCGNGAFLKEFGAALPSWTLDGSEHDRRHEAALTRIPGFRRLHAPDLPGPDASSYDLISVIHALEHMPDPAAWLARVRSLLAPKGTLLVQCPDAEVNPFDLVTADHLLHFTRGTLAPFLARSGFSASFPDRPWIAKELSAVCKTAERAKAPDGPRDPAAAAARVQRQVRWIEKLAAQARTLAARRPIGCFGTSIAGTWLAGEVGNGIGFFVDEDPDRAGTVYLGRPVLRPEEVERDRTVFAALAPGTAASVTDRLSRNCPGPRWTAPEPLAV